MNFSWRTQKEDPEPLKNSTNKFEWNSHVLTAIASKSRWSRYPLLSISVRKKNNFNSSFSKRHEKLFKVVTYEFVSSVNKFQIIKSDTFTGLDRVNFKRDLYLTNEILSRFFFLFKENLRLIESKNQIQYRFISLPSILIFEFSFICWLKWHLKAPKT